MADSPGLAIRSNNVDEKSKTQIIVEAVGQNKMENESAQSTFKPGNSSKFNSIAGTTAIFLKPRALEEG